MAILLHFMEKEGAYNLLLNMHYLCSANSILSAQNHVTEEIFRLVLTSSFNVLLN